MGKSKETGRRGASHWYVRAGIFAGFLGCLLMIAILTLGLEHHLASANPDLHVLSGHSPERLLWYYDALAALNVSLALFPHLVILPALVTGVGAFSVHAMGVLKDADSTGMKGGILHLSQLEERAYSILLFLLLAGWLAMFVCVPAPFRGLMLKLGVRFCRSVFRAGYRDSPWQVTTD